LFSTKECVILPSLIGIWYLDCFLMLGAAYKLKEFVGCSHFSHDEFLIVTHDQNISLQPSTVVS
jgi:hypothetical protein